MKWIISILALVFMVTPAVAGEDPYVAVIGNDIEANQFYLSPKYIQFLYDQSIFGVPVCFGGIPAANQFTRVGASGCEMFRSQTPLIQAEVCDTFGSAGGPRFSSPPFEDRGERNAKVSKQNSGFYEWYVRLPKKPTGEINLVLQCGILKPDTFNFYGYSAVSNCAAETGERVGTGLCTRNDVKPGVNPIKVDALPKVTAIVYPGPYNQFTPFTLTAYRNPGTYNPFDGTTGELVNNGAGQLLNGTDNGTRVLLKSCMDKTIVAKIPVTGQVNAAGQIENDLEAGDLIYVRIDIPRTNTVDIYCHAQSFKVMGIGEAPF